MNKLFLGSNSESRKVLLKNASISFTVIGHNADESSVDKLLPFEQKVLAIARLKMEHVFLPSLKEDNKVFVLTADTMGKSAEGQVYGKPQNKKEAIKILHSLSCQRHTTATGFCIDKKKYYDGAWITEKRIEKVVAASYLFNVPENWIDRYLEHSWAMKASSAIAIEGYGEQFLKNITGSYTTVMGLPMFELRQALEEIGFFK